MKKPRKPTFGNRLSYFALLGIENLMRIIPIAMVWHVGASIGWLAYPLAGSRRKVVLKNLKIVHPNHSDKQRDNLAREVFRYSFANLFSSVKTGTMSIAKLKKRVTLDGLDVITNLPKDKGCVFMVSHMGNWEILTNIHKLMPLNKPSGAMFQTLKNPYVNQHVLKGREREGMRLFAKKRGLLEATKFLKNGGALGILSDQYAGKRGIFVDLFGHKTSISPLTATMAQKYGCPIVSVIVTTESAGRWKLSFTSPIYISKDIDKTAATIQLIEPMENIMKTYSKDIFWLHDRWKQRSLPKR